MMMRENPFDYVEEKPRKKTKKKDAKGSKKRPGVAE
jgi:hypothetical protein